jgi:hypothetical protein
MQPPTLNRRDFITSASLAATSSALGFLPASGAESQGTKPERRIKLGQVGCGGRGSWIAKLFQKHGGYEYHAVADYFPATVEKCGGELGVAPARRFSTLSGYSGCSCLSNPQIVEGQHDMDIVRQECSHKEYQYNACI